MSIFSSRQAISKEVDVFNDPGDMPDDITIGYSGTEIIYMILWNIPYGFWFKTPDLERFRIRRLEVRLYDDPHIESLPAEMKYIYYTFYIAGYNGKEHRICLPIIRAFQQFGNEHIKFEQYIIELLGILRINRDYFMDDMFKKIWPIAEREIY